MTLSTFATVIGILELVAGLPMMLFPRRTAESFTRLLDDENLLRAISAATLVLCALPLLEDPSIGFDTAGLVRLLAWVGAVKGLVNCWIPKHVTAPARWILARPVLVSIGGAIGVALGVLLIVAGQTLA